MFFKRPLFEIVIDIKNERYIRVAGNDKEEVIRLMKVANEFITNTQKQTSSVKNSPPSKP